MAIVAVVVVVAAACVVVFNNSDDSKNNDESGSASHLQIRGNANDDMTIDSADMSILDDVIAGDKTLEDYPLADVNNDGSVDQTDKTLLQNLIDRKEGTKAYVICLDVNGNTVAQAVTYPLRNVVTFGTNIQLPTLYANGGQYVAGYFKSSYSSAESSIASTAVDLKGDTRAISDTAWSNFTHLDGSITGGLGALLVDYSGVAAITETRQADLKDGEIPLLIYSSADASAEIQTVLTLGFLFGGDCETLGLTYATTSLKVMDEVNDKVKDIDDSDKTTFIACTMYIYICQNGSTFATSGVSAGGMPYYKVNSEFAAAYAGTGSVKMQSVEALSNYQDIGAILNNRSMDYGLDPSEVKNMILTSWDHDNSGTSSTQYFKGFDDKLAYIDNLLPGAVKVAYMAHALYGDKFSLDYANNVLQSFIDMGTAPLEGQTLDTIVAYIDYNTYQKAKGTDVVTVGDNALDMEYSFTKNYTGKYLTGKDDATMAFQNGSGETKSVLGVANGNSDTEKALNTLTIKVVSDAKVQHTANYSAYSAMSGYTQASLTSSFYGIYACYSNNGGVGVAYLSAYIQDVLVEGYLYESYDITVADLQALVDSLYYGVTNPVEYDGPEIPPEGGYSGAMLAAANFASAHDGWTVKDGSTAEVATLVYAGVSAMGSAKEYTVVIYCGNDIASKYTEAAAVVTALDGEKASTKVDTSTYGAITDTIDGVTYVAEFGQITNGGYVNFAMKVGDLFVDASASKIYILGTDAKPDATQLVKDFATAIVPAASAGAELVAKMFTVNENWSVKEGATSEAATLVYAGVSAMGSAKEYTVQVVSGTDASSTYTTASATVSALDGEKASTKVDTSAYKAITETIDGVTYVAEFGQITNGGYLNFTMTAGDRVIDGSSAKLYILGTDAMPDAISLLKAFAAAILA